MKKIALLSTLILLGACGTWQSAKYAGSQLNYNFSQDGNSQVLKIDTSSFTGSASAMARAVDTAQRDLAAKRCGDQKLLITEDSTSGKMATLRFRCI